jgi:restriction system protein
MLPLLEFARDGQEHSLRETIDRLAEEFGLSEYDRKQLLPSGQQEIFDNRVSWARTYLTKAGLLMKTKRSHYMITNQGRKVLAQNLERLDVKYLKQFEEFREFQSLKGTRSGPNEVGGDISGDNATPEESLESAYDRLRKSLANEVLTQVKASPASLFEKLVVELLLKMGYGGSRQDAGRAIGRSGDEGIDGIIKEDRLGLDIIYIQAKRWEANVGRPEVQKFAGALQGQRAKKGIMLTTSSYSRDAREYVSSIENKIVLIDGEQLADLMIDHNLGVSSIASYEVKKIDTDYFAD